MDKGSRLTEQSVLTSNLCIDDTITWLLRSFSLSAILPSEGRQREVIKELEVLGKVLILVVNCVLTVLVIKKSLKLICYLNFLLSTRR